MEQETKKQQKRFEAEKAEIRAQFVAERSNEKQIDIIPRMEYN